MIPLYIIALGAVIVVILLILIIMTLKKTWELGNIRVYSVVRYKLVKWLAFFTGMTFGGSIGAVLMWGWLSGVIQP